MILNRKAFAELWKPLLGPDVAPLWIPEEVNKTRCHWFVKVKPFFTPSENNAISADSHWGWCETCLQGKVMCFSASHDEEWWGFNNEDDISVWLLKWS